MNIESVYPRGVTLGVDIPVSGLGNGATIALPGAAFTVNGQLDFGLLGGDDRSDAEEGVH